MGLDAEGERVELRVELTQGVDVRCGAEGEGRVESVPPTRTGGVGVEVED